MRNVKLLFSHSYFYRFDPKQWNTHQPYPPYGTLSAAAYLREAGFEARLFDSNLIHEAAEILPVLQQENPQYLVLYDDGFNYLTKMCLTRMREAAFELIRYGKAAGCRVIVSSSDSTDHSAQYLSEGADVVLIGEAELSLRELLEAWEQGAASFEHIPGLAFMLNGEVLRTAPRQVLRDLDLLPQPAWDLVDIEPYREIWTRHHRDFFLNLATTRGCPFKCNWCAKPIYGNRYNSRSPGRVADEIAFLMQRFGVKHFWMADDIFGLKPGWVQEFRDIVKARGLQFHYKIQSRVDLLLKEDSIEALVESGLQTVWVGAESGSQKVLDAMDKGTRVEQIYAATRLLKAKGVRVGFFLQFGYPGETAADIQKTLDMLEELRPHEIGVSISYPLPGTVFYERVKAELGEKQNWVNSDDLDLMFRGAYSPAYYRRLHRYVHKRFRRRQGLDSLQQVLRTPFGAAPSTWRAALATAYYLPSAAIDRLRLNRLSAS